MDITAAQRALHQEQGALQRKLFLSHFSPDAIASMPFWMLSAVGDDRNDTHAKCAARVCRLLDGKVFSKNDWIARALFPPLHAGCRCAAISFETIEEAGRNGGTLIRTSDLLAILVHVKRPSGRLSRVLESLESGKPPVAFK